MSTVDPFVLTYDIFGALRDLFGRFAKSRVSIFLMGAQGTGKTSFRKTLQYLSVEDIRGTSRSTSLENSLIKYPAGNEARLELICRDFGGDDLYMEPRRQKIIETVPLAILFFVDHQDMRIEMPQDLRASNDRMAVREWEIQNRSRLARFDDRRIEAHQRHFDDLIQILQVNQMLRKHTRLIIPIVTKYDIWRGIWGLDDFHNRFADKVRQLSNLDRIVAPFMAASPVDYYGTPEIMNTLFARAGREFQILRWTYRHAQGD